MGVSMGVGGEEVGRKIARGMARGGEVESGWGVGVTLVDSSSVVRVVWRVGGAAKVTS
jgi:uncharacterized protein GlcG (DUF336 family)